jgi:pyruvate dehydrogenase E1 component alpha subunit
MQSATPSFALRAAGYGFPGVEVDGNDLLAVYGVASEAVQRARAGDGPTLIESITYRMSFHNTTDNPSLYEDPKERDEASRRDPIDRVVKHLTLRGLWDEERDKQTRARVRAEIDAAIEKAAAFPAVTPSQLFEHIYSELPERVRRQRAELLGEGSPS